MAIQQAPSEILEQIFLLLNDAKECMSVCKAWHLTASRIFYSEVTLTRHNASEFIRHNGQSGQWVRYLNFHKKMDSISVAAFEELVYQVPNVKVLDLTGIGKSVLPPLLEVLVTKAGFQCMDEIKVNSNLSGKGREQHFLACYQSRKTIRRLNLNNFRSCYTINDLSGNCLEFLPQFQQLTQLSIHNDLLHGDRYMLISTVLDTCPKLIQFGLFTKRHFPDGSKPGLLQMMENDVTVTKLKALKNMEFELHDFHEGYIKYIVLYTQLQRLKVHMMDTDVHDWLTDKENVIIPFAQYLSGVEQVELVADIVTGKRQRNNSLGHDKMTRHWQFINTVMAERKLHCHVYLSMKGGYSDDQRFKLNVDKKKMILEYQLTPEYPTNNLIRLFNTEDDSFMIDSMEVGDASRYRLEDCIQLVYYVRKKCPDIKFLLVNRSSTRYVLEAIEYPYDLQFDRVHMGVGEGRKYTAKTTKEKINHVSLKEAILSTVTMQVLCPSHVKVLKLINCILPSILDLTFIQHLHYLEIQCDETDLKTVLSNPIDLISIRASSPIVVQT
ncbi:uncharacterized protein EV154DRAFT_490815 [Mucor mucedo]|uniref:uncharacterized protein n=1 Tax=Mucor mucedo TaxID=29922 RepID=UPI00221E3981|nr:uncharacterized protein EV154DRAFT_490815 [Mucor mucedo]KAI7896786.1 hypothetical protein EV154DRAFT_490815 [Mucor mucedo]